MINLTFLIKNKPDIFFFLNNPESVKIEQNLGSGKIEANQKFRIFYHFCNKTKNPLEFKLITDDQVSYIHSCSTSLFPEIAGAFAVKNFLAKPNTKTEKINFSKIVPSAFTISGIFEGQSINQTQFHSYMGKQDHDNWVLTIPMTNYQALITNNFTQSIGLFSPIDGDYGLSYNYIIKNTTQSKVKVEISVEARGGKAFFPVKIDNKTWIPPLLLVKKKQIISTSILDKNGEIKLSTIPAGGCNYPVKLCVKFQ